MTGFDSKRQAALDKLFEVENELGLHYDQRPPMTKDEALKLAHMKEALKYLQAGAIVPVDMETTTLLVNALKEALAQPEQEPVGRFAKFTDGIWREVTDGSAGQPLYTTPQQRTWVGLTEQNFSAINQSCLTKLQAATSAESILKEKNT